MVFFYFFIFCFFPKSVNVVPNHVTPLTELIFFWHFVWRVEKFIVSTCVRWRVTEGQLSQEKHLLLILLHTVMLFFPVLVVLSHAFSSSHCCYCFLSSALLSLPNHISVCLCGRQTLLLDLPLSLSIRLCVFCPPSLFLHIPFPDEVIGSGGGN